MKVVAAIMFAIGTFCIGLVVSPMYYVIQTGDFPGTKVMYDLQEDDPLVLKLLEIHEWVK